jgi:hypothetical protein
MNFLEFASELERRGMQYELPEGWPVPKPSDLLYPARRTVRQMARDAHIPVKTFAWMLAAWRHHSYLTATIH